jgi:lipopolysaccharide export system permease protein
MGTTLDRMFLVNYLRSYLIVLTSLLSLYVIVDLFTNLDDFSGGGFQAMLERIVRYYSTRISQIFDRLSEAITLLGATFTVAWMQRNNELLPQLSAGVPTRRVIRPVIVGSIATLLLGPLNQEFIIPRIAEDLTRTRDDLEGERPTQVKGAFDPTGVHIEGAQAFRGERKIAGLFVVLPVDAPGGMAHLSASEAYYIPPVGSPRSGGWMLFHTKSSLPEDRVLPPNLERLGYEKYFLRTKEVDFDAVTRGGSWYLYASTPKLREILSRPDQRRQPAVAVTFHMRITRLLVGAILVLLGLAVILRDQNRHVFINAGLCLVLCAIFYATVYGCKYLGDNDFVSPPLAAWLPVLIFGPVAVALIDAIHT